MASIAAGCSAHLELHPLLTLVVFHRHEDKNSSPMMARCEIVRTLQSGCCEPKD
jgi:hypothetical protein